MCVFFGSGLVLNLAGRMYNSSVWYRPFDGEGLGGVQANWLQRAWTVTRVALARDIVERSKGIMEHEGLLLYL